MQNLLALIKIPDSLVNPIISAVAIISGTILGSIFSWFITKNSICKNVEFQNKLVEDNRKYAENKKIRRGYELACIIRLDICNAMFQSIRTLQENDECEINLYPIPMSNDYSSVVAYLKNDFDLKEMSLIYQLYGMIEKLNNDIKNFTYYNNDNYSLIKQDCELFLKKMYGNNINEIIEMNIDSLTYEELYNNEIIKEEYKNVLTKLDLICNK